MKPPIARAGWLAAACVAVAGCSPSSIGTGAGDENVGDGGGGGGTAGSVAGAGAFAGMAGPASGGTGATTLAGGGGLAGGGALAGMNGGGSAGTSGASAAGTAGSDVGGSASGSAGVAGTAGASGAAPTFTEIWNRTLENGCATPYCHDGSGKGWSGYDQATAYRTLVGFASTTCPGETRVVPGDPASSVLAAAISHTDLGSCDVPTMPRDRAKLSQADIERIVAWIRAGARDD